MRTLLWRSTRPDAENILTPLLVDVWFVPRGGGFSLFHHHPRPGENTELSTVSSTLSAYYHRYWKLQKPFQSASIWLRHYASPQDFNEHGIFV